MEYRDGIFFHKGDMLFCPRRCTDICVSSCRFPQSWSTHLFHYKMSIGYQEEQFFPGRHRRHIFGPSPMPFPCRIIKVLLFIFFLLYIRKNLVKLIQHTNSVDMCLLKSLPSLLISSKKQAN